MAFSRRRSRSGKRARAALFLLFAALGSRPARAYDAAVDSSFAAQLYRVSSAFGGPEIGRQRYVETLSLRVWDLEGAHVPGGPTLSAVARLRLDADFGIDPAETSLLSGIGGSGLMRPRSPERFVPGLSEVPFDLMMAYVEGRGYADGLVGFRLGRQYVVDALGFWSFDGGLVRLTTPVHFAVEAYGGAEQRGGLPMLSTSRFEADGVWRGNRRGLDDALLPAYLAETEFAPAYGFALASTDLDFLDARVTYRKVVNRDAVVVAPFPDALGRYEHYGADRVSSEKLGAAAVATVNGAGALRGNVVYDALVQKPMDYGGSIDVTAIPSIELGADAAYFFPTFDGDSIFNWFSHMSTVTVDGRVRWKATRRVSFGATAGARRFGAEAGGELADVLGSVDGLYRAPLETATLRAMDEHGDRGHRRGVDLSYKRLFVGGLYEALTMASLYDWSDALRPVASTTSFTYVVGGGYRPFRRTRIGLEWEHSMSELVGHRFRALCTLDLTVL